MADNTAFNTGSGGDTLASDDIGGVKYERGKLIHGADGTNDGDIAKANPLPALITNTGRTELRFSNSSITITGFNTEQLVTLTKSSDTSATTTGTSFVVTSGKRFRITGVHVSVMAGTTAVQAVEYSIRINTAGAIATTSTAIYRTRTGLVSKSINAMGPRINEVYGFGGIDIPGDGTLQWGVTLNGSSANGRASVLITGYEY